MFRPRLIGLLLALVTLLLYLPAAWHAFVIFDDGDYVTENRMVQQGLTWAGVKWALSTGHASNWHPLTWLSHMADCELFGLNSGAHHLVNVLFHVVNTALLYALLLRLTGFLWPSALVAALFAWHPLHVESVAWVSERKDVLSTCFGLLALLAYARYAQKQPRVESRGSKANAAAPVLVPRPSTLDYSMALVCFALGLMAKPMLVTLPFVMLLLDYWPLQRLSTLSPQPSTLRRLVLEKWPFFLLTAGSCVTTYLAQSQKGGGAVVSLEQVSLAYRVCNALTSYGRYLLKTIWPVDLAVFYPLSDEVVGVRITAFVAVLVLAAISWIVWRQRRPFPYLLVGWLWFLGTLVPVIGLVQVGSAALADRYTYLPLIGPFMAFAFGARDLAHRARISPMAAGAAAALTLGACLLLTEKQLHCWRDSESLFARAVAVTRNNATALNNYGVALEEAGRLEEALARYREAVRVAPEHALAQYNIGNVLDKLGRSEAARPELFRAVLLNPLQPSFHKTFGVVLVKLGRFDEASRQFVEAARLDPRYPWAPFETGRLYLKQGRDAEAIDEFRRALQLDPDNFQILASTAHVLAADENPRGRDGKAALVLALKANTVTGGNQPFVLDVMGMACAEVGRFDEAQEAARRALDLANAAQMKNLEPIQQRLRLYQNHQPWRESFLATNAPQSNQPFP
jgi:protein O-mannosyl-transferase